MSQSHYICVQKNCLKNLEITNFGGYKIYCAIKGNNQLFYVYKITYR